MEAGPRDRPFRDEGDTPGAGRAGEAPADGAVPRLPVREDGAVLPIVGAQVPGPAGVLPLHGAEGGDQMDPLPGQQPADEHELRPARRLRLWQTAPIVALGVLGSLMFAFPLAFEVGDGGPVVAMLGLLLSASSAGWGIMVARRVGYTWPGLPPRGSGGRPDWRFVAAYVLLSLLIGALAVWRVARLH